MKITKKVKGIILTGVVVLMLSTALVLNGGGFNIGTQIPQTIASVDPPGN